MKRPLPPAGSGGACTLAAQMRPLLPALLAITAACTSPGDLRPGAERPASVTSSINLSGFPPEYRSGFTDGCAAARTSDAKRPNAQGQYVVGWQDGYDYCRPKH